jgi:hypothetical protein
LKKVDSRSEHEKNAKKKKMDEQLREINKRLDVLSAGTEQKLNMKFNLPTEDFDRTLVRGRVANLF